jgi:hypothetical protein
VATKRSLELQASGRRSSLKVSSLPSPPFLYFQTFICCEKDDDNCRRLLLLTIWEEEDDGIPTIIFFSLLCHKKNDDNYHCLFLLTIWSMIKGESTIKYTQKVVHEVILIFLHINAKKKSQNLFNLRQTNLVLNIEFIVCCI